MSKFVPYLSEASSACVPLCSSSVWRGLTASLPEPQAPRFQETRLPRPRQAGCRICAPNPQQTVPISVTFRTVDHMDLGVGSLSWR